MRTYGIADELAAEVGLMCGGAAHVLIERLGPQSAAVLDAVFAATLQERPAAVATIVDGPSAGSRLAILDDLVLGGLGTGSSLTETSSVRLAASSSTPRLRCAASVPTERRWATSFGCTSSRLPSHRRW